MSKHSTFPAAENLDASQLIVLQAGINKRAAVALLDARVTAAIAAALAESVAVPTAQEAVGLETIAGTTEELTYTEVARISDLVPGWRYEITARLRMIIEDEEQPTFIQLIPSNLSSIRGTWIRGNFVSAGDNPDTFETEASLLGTGVHGQWLLTPGGENPFVAVQVALDAADTESIDVDVIMIARPIALIPEP